ncbi:hypothetical protein [Streptomyces sp. NPDC052494]|uniref:hypothetical protein n=1 Tax=Streptomyces sp. NPDC052494 TaxID=3365692 RepID=UPI0037D4071F
MPPSTTVLRPLGTPLPVGFLGLAAGAFIVSALQLGWIPPHERHAVAVVLVAVAFPLQLLAALIGFRARDTAFATAMALLATGWLVQGILLSAGPVPEARHTLGLFLLVTAVALLVPIAAAGAGKLAASAVIGCAALRLAAAGIQQHVQRVARSLPRLREHVAQDLAGRGLSRLRVLACLTRLLDLGFLRIGGERYARDNGSFGLTTLLREHVSCRSGEIRLHFPAKSGKEVERSLVDEQAHAVIRALLRRRDDGERLFAYWEHRAWHEVHAEDLNSYLQDRSGRDVTAKDFRTWYATVLAAVALAVSESTAHASRARRGKVVARAVREVSDYLGNTSAVCRASYIHPRIIELYEEGETIASSLGKLGENSTFGEPATHGRVERAVLKLLRSGTS